MDSSINLIKKFTEGLEFSEIFFSVNKEKAYDFFQKKIVEYENIIKKYWAEIIETSSESEENFTLRINGLTFTDNINPNNIKNNNFPIQNFFLSSRIVMSVFRKNNYGKNITSIYCYFFICYLWLFYSLKREFRDDIFPYISSHVEPLKILSFLKDNDEINARTFYNYLSQTRLSGFLTSPYYLPYINEFEISYGVKLECLFKGVQGKKGKNFEQYYCFPICFNDCKFNVLPEIENTFVNIDEVLTKIDNETLNKYAKYYHEIIKRIKNNKLDADYGLAFLLYIYDKIFENTFTYSSKILLKNNIHYNNIDEDELEKKIEKDMGKMLEEKIENKFLPKNFKNIVSSLSKEDSNNSKSSNNYRDIDDLSHNYRESEDSPYNREFEDSPEKISTLSEIFKIDENKILDNFYRGGDFFYENFEQPDFEDLEFYYLQKEKEIRKKILDAYYIGKGNAKFFKFENIEFYDNDDLKKNKQFNIKSILNLFKKALKSKTFCKGIGKYTIIFIIYNWLYDIFCKNKHIIDPAIKEIIDLRKYITNIGDSKELLNLISQDFSQINNIVPVLENLGIIHIINLLGIKDIYVIKFCFEKDCDFYGKKVGSFMFLENSIKELRKCKNYYGKDKKMLQKDIINLFNFKANTENAEDFETVDDFVEAYYWRIYFNTYGKGVENKINYLKESEIYQRNEDSIRRIERDYRLSLRTCNK